MYKGKINDADFLRNILVMNHLYGKYFRPATNTTQ